MKKFAIILAFSTIALAQNVRFDAQFPSINSQTAQPFLIANVPPNSPTLAVCHSPANQVPCTNFATTFNGLGVACSNGAQDTPQPALTSSCQSTGDAQGNIGFWVPAGTYDYTVCISTTCFGPFTITLSIGGAASPGGSTTQIQFNNSGAFGGLPNAAIGSALVSQGATTSPTFQVKPKLDVRDSSTSFDCTGTTAMDTAMQSIATTVHINVPTGCIVRLSSAHSYPQTIEFAKGGQFKIDTGILVTLTGPIIAGSYQIFTNALPTQGGIDFTGNANQFTVVPEWWGAVAGGAASTNTPAIQAAFYGAFGCNTSPVTSCRTNPSALWVNNKRLLLTGNYAINSQINFYHVIGFTIDCTGGGRLFSGLQQTAANQKILDGQSDAYGAFIGCSFGAVASEDINHPLIDLNFDGSQGADIKPQFIDFYNPNFGGSQSAKIGVRIAAAGGGAQGSNINFYNALASGFTEAAYMIGSGSGCSPTNIATNAVSINWYGGDMQSNFAYGIENFGGTDVKWDGGTAENGGDIASGNTHQTGVDFCANNLPQAGEPMTIMNVRSESMTAETGGPFNFQNVTYLDFAITPSPGGTGFLGDIIQGSSACGHGVYYDITVAGTFSGLGSRISPLTASAGSATTITDSVGGFTVNAWVGWNVCILGGTASLPPEYCTITSNTATTFTCAGGFLTDYINNGIAAPANGTTYDIEPNWGTQFTDGTVTFTRDDTTYGGISTAENVFFPGRRMAITPQTAVRMHNVQLTRADWNKGGVFLYDILAPSGIGDVLVGSPNPAGASIGSITVNVDEPLIRPYTVIRNGITEIGFPLKEDWGIRTFHWYAGLPGGAGSTTDIYTGVDTHAPTLNQGDWFIINNSASTGKKWTFNFDGSTTLPGVTIAGGSTPTITGTGACATISTQVGGLSAGLVTCTGTTGASTLVITPGITAAHGFRCPADDEITVANKLTQTAQNGTTCTISGTVNANDVIAFGPIVAF